MMDFICCWAWLDSKWGRSIYLAPRHRDFYLARGYFCSIVVQQINFSSNQVPNRSFNNAQLAWNTKERRALCELWVAETFTRSNIELNKPTNSVTNTKKIQKNTNGHNMAGLLWVQCCILSPSYWYHSLPPLQTWHCNQGKNWAAW